MASGMVVLSWSSQMHQQLQPCCPMTTGPPDHNTLQESPMLSLEHTKQYYFQRHQTFVLWMQFPGENANRWGAGCVPWLSLSSGGFCSLAPPRRTCTTMAADTGWSCRRLCNPEGLTSTFPGSLAWIWVILSCPCNAAANSEKEARRSCSPGNSSLSTRCHRLLCLQAGRQHNYSHSERRILLNCPFRTTPPISWVPVQFFSSLW